MQFLKTGDRLTFGIALERAQLEGINVKMFIVGDDCALSRDTNTSTGRRGLCGTVIFHKVCVHKQYTAITAITE